tara:strand:+ start:2677 stop:3513 length:837 start_codon:yes stop_codon:yes gene_type:complete
MARILPPPGQKIISLLLIFLGGIILYFDINTNNFQSIKNSYNSVKISTNFFIKNFSINPIIDFSKHFQFKEKLIKENNQLKLALEKSYIEKYLISQDSKFFKNKKYLQNIIDSNNLNKPYHIAQLKSLDPNIFYCCDKHRMHIQLVNETMEDLSEGVVFNSSGIIGHIINDGKYKEVMLFTDTKHSLPLKNISEDFFCNAKGSGKSSYIKCNYNPLLLSKEIEVGEIFFTSGLGGVYPRDIKVGILKEIKVIESNDIELNIQLLTNPLVSHLFGVINF